MSGQFLLGYFSKWTHEKENILSKWAGLDHIDLTHIENICTTNIEATVTVIIPKTVSFEPFTQLKNYRSIKDAWWDNTMQLLEYSILTEYKSKWTTICKHKK